MKRTIAIVVSLVVVLFALWHSRGRHEASNRPGGGSAFAGGSGGAGGANRPVVDDPRQRARGTIRGVVREAGGGPIAGAQVCTQWTGKGVVDEDSREPVCATTDAAGAYTLTELVTGSHQLSAGAAQHQPRTWRDAATGEPSVRLQPGETRTGVDFALAGGGVEVSGVVEDVSGGPVAGALVSVNPDGWWSQVRTAPTRTDAQGRFTVWSEPGTTTVDASAEGYASGQASSAAPSALVTIYLTPESTLSGTVVAAGDQHPIAGATVSVGGWFGEGSSGSARSDDAGRFRLTRLAPGRYKPTAEGDNLYGEPAESVLLGLGQSVDGVLITVGAASAVRGTITIDGTPPAPCPRGWIALNDHATDRRASAASELDGTVEMTSVLPGHYDVEVRCPDQVSQDRYPPIDVVAGKDVAGLVWTVTGGASIAGVVMRADGTPIADARVSARSTGGAARGQTSGAFTQSADDGTFHLRGLLAGDYLVRAAHDGDRMPMPPPKVTVPASGEVSIEIVAMTSGSIAGTVVDTDGKPVSGAGVRAAGVPTMMSDVMSGDDGSFRIDGVEPGPHRVVASHGWFATLRAPGTTDDDAQGTSVTVVAGQTTTARLVVEAQDGTITGSVVDGKGAPVIDAWIVATRETDRDGAAAGDAMRAGRWSWGVTDRPVITGVDGRFTVGKLSPGRYTLRAHRRGGGEALAEHVALGADARLTIARPGSVAGTVVAAGGGVPEAIDLTLSSEQTGFSRDESFFRTGGGFVLRDLPAGDFVLTADAAGGHATVNLTLAAGEERTGLTITLAAKLKVSGRLVDLDTAAPVAGIRVDVSPVRGARGGFSFGDQGGARTNISGEDGRFTVDNAPGGLIEISGMPKDFLGSRYGWLSWIADVTGGPEVDLGDVPIVKRRFEISDKPADLGVAFAEPAPDADPRQRLLTVSHVKPGSSAAQGGVVAGDVVVAIDGYDVKGVRACLASPLLRVRIGTVVKLGLQRGPTVTVTAAAP